MSNTKGHIEPTKNPIQALNWIEEVLDKLHKDSLNVKEEEYKVAIETIDLLKEKTIPNLQKNSNNWDKVKKKLTANQLLHVLEND